MASIAFDHVTKTFDGAPAVNDLCLEIADGELLVLLGPSGCGKTTVLRMLAGLEEVTSGRILIGDRVVNDLLPADRDVAMVFQSYALYPHMSVYDNLAFSLRNRGLPKAEIDRRVREVTGMLDLAGLLERKPKQLSGGQRQRVALGRAIVREPAAFLMDEPLSNLDAALRVQTRAEILKLQERLGVTTVYVTHDQVEAMTMGNRIAVMRNGVLQQVGTPQEVYTRPANVFVASFIGTPPMNLVPGGALDGIGAPGQIVGFRPEHVQLGGSHGLRFRARVEVVEYLGDELLAHLRAGDAALVAKLPVVVGVVTGEEREFSVPPRQLRLFDAKSERALDTANLVEPARPVAAQAASASAGASTGAAASTTAGGLAVTAK